MSETTALRADFLKVTATLSPEVYKLVSDEMQRRKLARGPNAQMSAILREAVLLYFTVGANYGYKPNNAPSTSTERMRRCRL